MSGDGTVTVTIRLIRSFHHRNVRQMVLKYVRLDQSTDDFKEFILKEIKTRPEIPPPFKTFEFDTLKIEYVQFGGKSSDPVINRFEDEKLLLKPGSTLREAGIGNESDISFFKMVDYKEYQENPTSAW